MRRGGRVIHLHQLYNLLCNTFKRTEMTDAPVLVFTYGTLKRGQPNHGLMLNAENGSATFVGRGVTANRYPLIISTAYNIPFMLLGKGTGENVVGEVYKVDRRMLVELDALENHPYLYERFLTTIQLTEDQTGTALHVPKTIECWCYFLTKFKTTLLNLPFMKSYDSNGSHGLKYSARCDRKASDYDLMGEVKEEEK